ncbi:hypothetical protein ACFPIF_10530 [Brevundimonas faecalis]|uniref:hypothetical protein n=1 Tax=Brevundimonas faecalis TaxID=947378 RepID=UPI00360888C5
MSDTVDDLKQAIRGARLAFARSTRALRGGKAATLVATRPKAWRLAVSRRISARAATSSLFDPLDYAHSHPGVRETGLDPVSHFATRGLPMGRSAFSPGALARLMHNLDADHLTASAEFLAEFERAQGLFARIETFVGVRSFAVVVHSAANHYMRPLAEALRRALSAGGADCPLMDEADPRLESIDIPIVVAPHEFFDFELPPAIQADAFIAKAVLFNTEQLPSPWFARAARHLFRARAVLDVNFQTARALGRDFPALHVLPGYDTSQMEADLACVDPFHPMFRWAPPAWYMAETGRPWEERDFDLLFTGYRTPVRDRILARMAADLARRETLLAYGSLPAGSSRIDEKTRSLFANNVAAARNSRLILNISRYPMGYFEWERMVVQGAAAGACVVSSMTLPSPFFTPGQHYYETVSRNVDKLMRWLLDDADGQAAATAAAVAASEVLTTQLTPERVGRHVLAFLMDIEAT